MPETVTIGTLFGPATFEVLHAEDGTATLTASGAAARCFDGEDGPLLGPGDGITVNDGLRRVVDVERDTAGDEICIRLSAVCGNEPAEEH